MPKQWVAFWFESATFPWLLLSSPLHFIHGILEFIRLWFRSIVGDFYSLDDYINMYQGMWDCYPDEDNELMFKRGEIIHILSRVSYISGNSIVAKFVQKIMNYQKYEIPSTHIRFKPSNFWLVVQQAVCHYQTSTCFWVGVKSGRPRSAVDRKEGCCACSLLFVSLPMSRLCLIWAGMWIVETISHQSLPLSRLPLETTSAFNI